MTDFEFEPFYDYAKITDEMVQDMYAATREMEQARAGLLASPSREAVERLLKAVDNVEQTGGAIMQFILTVPVLVHLAGPPQEEHAEIGDEDSPIISVQRCVRCKSPLMGWRPGMMHMTPSGPAEIQVDEVTWWDEGSTLAKATLPSGGIAQYVIEDRELERHERECVGLPSM